MYDVCMCCMFVRAVVHTDLDGNGTRTFSMIQHFFSNLKSANV